uniref:Uncharacterized protein n=1 Tax=Arion vulgaris TaxID=1028688 RepID=A0A0B6Y0D3_9EUPU
MNNLTSSPGNRLHRCSLIKQVGFKEGRQIQSQECHAVNRCQAKMLRYHSIAVNSGIM